MVGLGTAINVICIVVGGLLGRFVGKLFSEDQQDAV
jgi:uncharacterized membrane protein YqgA involved in biofilm formation